MSIFPLPVFEADRDPSHRDGLTDAEAYERLKPPTSIVVRIGRMRHVGEYPYRGDAKPGCGSKLVARTHRGTEIVEMLTTTCGNSGCSKSVSRQEMLEYIENSGGCDYPFHTDGQVLRVATVEDLNRWSEVQTQTAARVRDVKSIVAESGLPMKVVDVEPVLGQEHLTVYFMSEERVDFRELVRRLAAEFQSRIEMRQVGARDEARLVADYERCGQHCCCKNFLKVLKPISMRSAKVQKATLDPLKISGRCGRLMCCLRYEDETYEDLKKRLPRNKSRVGTSEGPGIVVDGKILVQLVLVQLEHDGREIAVPVEELMDPNECPQPKAAQPNGAPAAAPRERRGGPRPSADAPRADPLRGLSEEEVARRVGDRDRAERGDRTRAEQQDAFSAEAKDPSTPRADGERRRRRRRRGEGSDGPVDDQSPASPDDRDASVDEPSAREPTADGPADGPSEQPDDRRGRRRRRRRRGGGQSGGDGEADRREPGPDSDSPSN